MVAFPLSTKKKSPSFRKTFPMTLPLGIARRLIADEYVQVFDGDPRLSRLLRFFLSGRPCSASKIQKTVHHAEDKLSNSSRENAVKLETESISIQHVALKSNTSKKVSSAFPMNDGRARSLYSPSRSSNSYRVLSLWRSNHHDHHRG